MIIFFLSLLVVIIGAEWFLQAALSLARILRLPEMVIGATLVSLATTMPENLVSIFASSSLHSHLAWGNAIGSGLVNLGLILGLAFLFGHPSSTLPMLGRGRRRSLILFFLILFLFLWLVIFGAIDFSGGLLLISLGAGFLLYTLWYALREAGENLSLVEEKLQSHPRVLIKLMAGTVLLIGGAKLLVATAVFLAKILAVPEIVIGVTLLAVGTSLPELVTALTALATHHERVTAGNLTGATVLTLTFSLGLAAVFGGIKVDRQVLLLDFSFLFLFSLLVLLFAFLPKVSKRLIGGLLISAYFLYLALLFLK